MKRKNTTKKLARIESDIPAVSQVRQIQSVTNGKSYFWGIYKESKSKLVVLTDDGIYEQV